MRHAVPYYGVLAAALCCAPAHAAEAQKTAFQRPLRIIVPFTPGGGQDTIARVLSAKLTEITGQQVLVDNRAGGGGIIAGEMLLKAPADGHTMYLTSTGFVVTPALRKSLPFDTLKDFAPVTRISNTPGTLVVHASMPVRNVRELVKLAKAKPGQITFGSAGVASQSHLSGELLKVLAGIDILHVPYRGSALAAGALVGGEVVMTFSSGIAALPHVKAGKLKMLGVTTATRSPFLPNVPTVAEAGVPGFENTSWSGIVVSAATPKPMVSALHEALARAMQMQDVKDRLAAETALAVTTDTPAEYGAFIKSEIEKWTKVVRQANIRTE